MSVERLLDPISARSAITSGYVALPQADAPRWSRRVTADIVSFLDIAVILISAMLTGLLHDLWGLRVVVPPLALAQICLITAATTHFVLRQLAHYDIERIDQVTASPGRLGLGLVISFSIVIATAHTLGVADRLPKAWFPVWLGGTLALLVIERFAVRMVLKRAGRRGVFVSNVAVYGAGRIAHKLEEHVARSGAALRLVGIYDDRADPARIDTQGLPIAGRLEDLIRDGREGLIDEIVIALPQTADHRIAGIARRLEQLPVRIRVCTHISSDLVDLDARSHKVSSIGPLGLLDLKSNPLPDWAPFLKRVEDVVISSVALTLALPVMLVVAALIKLDSRGPVFFRQKRHGLNHRVIEVLKFRTMRVMEDGAGVRQATRDDPRITRVGRILRKTSLDELPQLINIIRGEMSLVGPRPHAIVHNEQYGEMLERYANRHQVKPGLTGWAQVNGFRGETRTPEAMEARVEHDLYYIDNWSLWLDLRILALTPLYGFVHRNAF